MIKTKSITEKDLDNISFELKPEESVDIVDKTHYVNNKELQAEFVKYHERKMAAIEKGDPIPPLTNKIGEAILQISKRRVNSRNFCNYSEDWKEEMTGDAIQACVLYVHNYNPTKYDNPFAYITQLVTNAIITRLKKERKGLYTKYKLYDANGGFYADADDNLNEEDLDLVNETSDMYRDHLSFIASYEESMKNNKKKEDKGLF